MAVWQSVSELKDGQGVNASTFNKPIGELASRTDWLKNKVNALAGQDYRSAIVVPGLLDEKDLPEVGDIVCVDPGTGKYRKAVAAMSLYDVYTASEKAFAVGMLTAKDSGGLSGYVTLYGKVGLPGSLNMPDLVEPGEKFVTGQYYLSSTTPGKITRFPAGPRILVGFFARNPQNTSGNNAGEVFLNPQHMDIESHSHRTFVLLPRPCGESYVPVGGNTVFVGGYRAENGNDTAPRLIVEGDWTAPFNEAYDIVASANGGWPVSISWTSENGLQKGSGSLGFYGDSIAVGKYGLRVHLESIAGDEETTFTDDLAWKVDSASGRGWASAAANVSVPFVYEDFAGSPATSETRVRLTGVSDKPINNIVVKVPSRVYDLTDLPLPGDNDQIDIDGEIYTFTHDPDAEGENMIQLLGTADDAASVFETMRQICDVNENAFYYESPEDTLKQVLVGASSVRYSEAPEEGQDRTWDGDIGCVFDNTETVSALLVGYDSGESLAPKFTAVNRGYSVIPQNFTDSSTGQVSPPNAFSVRPLTNGMSIMLTGEVAVGYHVGLSAYCVPGAAFRYRIEADNNLKLHFPPVPARSGSLMLNGVEVPSVELFGDAAILSIGADSLYWRDGTVGRQPWPLPEMKRTDKVDPEDEYQETFHFVSAFHSETGPVTSLHPAKGSPITIHRCGTSEDASVGDLELDVDYMIQLSDQNKDGYRVPKASRNGKLLLGPVVERLVAGPGISFSHPAGMPEGQGSFTISADGAAYSGDFETVALENAKIGSAGMFPYTRMLKWDPGSSSNVPTGFVAKFHVPATIADGTYRVKFYASVFGEESYSGSQLRYAGVTLDYSILPDWKGDWQNANILNGTIKPDDSINLAIPLGASNEDDEENPYKYTAYDPILIHNDTDIIPQAGNNALVVDHAIPTREECSKYITDQRVPLGPFGIRPGYTVALRFSRSAPMLGTMGGTAYTGPIGFLNLRWSIEQVSALDSGKTINTEDIVNSTVMRLRKMAAGTGPMDNVDAIVGILTRVIAALQ